MNMLAFSSVVGASHGCGCGCGCGRGLLHGKVPNAGANMDESDFDGTLVLEQLAAIGLVDDFFEAIDADDVPRAVSLMRKAKVDAATIAVVVKKMQVADGKH